METLVSVLNDIATLLELGDENPFKIRAIQSAARALDDADIDSMSLNEMLALPGVGKGTGELIAEFLETGSIAQYHQLLEQIPESVLEMTRLRGLGAKKVRSLWKELGIQSVNELHTACEISRVAAFKGFGAKTQANILEAIAQYRSAQDRFHLHKAMREAERLCEVCRAFESIQTVEIVGELRQGEETVSRIALVVCGTDILHFEQQCKESGTELAQGSWEAETLCGTSTNDIPFTIQWATPSVYALCLHEQSSQAPFHEAFVHLRRERGIATIAAASEAELYEQSHLPLIPPELRTNPELLSDSRLPHTLENLISLSDIRGTVHVHSTWSDGKHSIRQMAERAKALGCEYIGICDHSKTAVYANGLSEERLKRQHEEIDALNAENLGIRILKGIESDILTDGSLDYPDSVLETFDMVVASVHSAFTLSHEQMTKRLIRALEHPATTILGHPTGRLLLKRKGYTFDVDAIVETARKHGKVIEINANPYRLDFSTENAAKAHTMGVMLSINTDAHNCEDLAQMHYGVQVARRAALPRTAILNTLGLDDFQQHIQSMRR